MSKLDLTELPSSERSKIKAVVKNDNKSDLTWMYEGRKQDSESYLLGKKVKTLEELTQIPELEETPAQRIARYDMEVKYREDPLRLMRQRETEKRQELLQNTVKVKKLRRLLNEQKIRNDKREKRLSKRKRARSSSSDDSSGDELLKQFITIIEKSDFKDDSDQNSSVQPQSKHDNQSDHDRTASQNQSRKRHSFEQRDHRTTDGRNDKYDSSHKHHAYQERNYHDRRKEKDQTDSRNSRNRPDRYEREHSSKMSKEEMETRRAEMIQNAKQHKQEQFERIDIHKRRSERDLKRDQSEREQHGPSFLSTLKNQHTQRLSVAEGVQRRAGTRQRGDTNSNFLRR